MTSRFSIHCLLFALSVVGFVTACGNAPQQESFKPVPPASMFVEHMAAFCAPTEQDKFTAGYYGDNPLHTMIYFYIICHEKDTTYHAEWEGNAFLAEDEGTADTSRINHIHHALHDLVEGKLAPPRDSVDLKPAGNQPIFGYSLANGKKALLYYASDKKRVVDLIH